MNIYAEDLEKACAFLPGLFKFEEKEPFKQALLALCEDALLIYNDNAPDSTFEDKLNYSVKYRFPLTAIVKVTNEILQKQPELAGLNRIALTVENSGKPFYFYYFNNDKTSNNFFAGFKHFGVTVETTEVNLLA